jgi:hypothetical protein
MGRAKKNDTVASAYDAKVADGARAAISTVLTQLEVWESGDEMALDKARSAASSINNLIYWHAIDPSGEMRKSAAARAVQAEKDRVSWRSWMTPLAPRSWPS